MARPISRSLQSQELFRQRANSSPDNRLNKFNIPGFQIAQKLISGDNGTIYRAYDAKANRDVAVKIDRDLTSEAIFLNECQGIPGILQVYSTGQTQNKQYIIMELLQHDLNDMRLLKVSYSLKTVLLIGLQMIQILREVHEMNIVHRNIRPSNIMIKSLKEKQLFLVDFGLAKMINMKNNQVSKDLEFDAISVHIKQDYAYIDDIEMLAYCLVYFYRGELPWKQQISLTDQKIVKLKQDLLNNKGTMDLPFTDVFAYIRMHNRGRMPNYQFLTILFKQLLRKNNISEDYSYDWCNQISILHTPQVKSKFAKKGSVEIQPMNLIEEETLSRKSGQKGTILSISEIGIICLKHRLLGICL